MVEFVRALFLWALFTDTSIYGNAPKTGRRENYTDVQIKVRELIVNLLTGTLSKNLADRAALSIFKQNTPRDFYTDAPKKIKVEGVDPEGLNDFFYRYLLPAHIGSNTPIPPIEGPLHELLLLVQEQTSILGVLQKLSAVEDESTPNLQASTYDSNGNAQVPFYLVSSGIVLDDTMLRRRIRTTSMDLSLEEPSDQDSFLTLPPKENRDIACQFEKLFKPYAYSPEKEELQERIRRAQQSYLYRDSPSNRAWRDFFRTMTEELKAIMASDSFLMLPEADQAKAFGTYTNFLFHKKYENRRQEIDNLVEARKYAEMAANLSSSDLREEITSRLQRIQHIESTINLAEGFYANRSYAEAARVYREFLSSSYTRELTPYELSKAYGDCALSMLYTARMLEEETEVLAKIEAAKTYFEEAGRLSPYWSSRELVQYFDSIIKDRLYHSMYAPAAKSYSAGNYAESADQYERVLSSPLFQTQNSNDKALVYGYYA